MTTPFVVTPKSTTGSADKQLKVVAQSPKEELSHEEETEKAKRKQLRRERFANRIVLTKRLSLGQKEQALSFLFHPAYLKDGYRLAREYVRLCLNPKYMVRGTAWTGAENKRRVKPFQDRVGRDSD